MFTRRTVSERKRSMDFNTNREKYIKTDRQTGNDEDFASLDKVNSNIEVAIDNLMNDLDTESFGRKFRK